MASACHLVDPRGDPFQCDAIRRRVSAVFDIALLLILLQCFMRFFLNVALFLLNFIVISINNSYKTSS